MWSIAMKENDLWNKIKVGSKLVINFGKGNLNNCTLHVRGIVDIHYVVVRQWSKKSQYWRYRVETMTYLLLLYKSKHLSIRSSDET